MHSSSTVKYSQDKNLPELSELCHTCFSPKGIKDIKLLDSQTLSLL